MDKSPRIGVPLVKRIKNGNHKGQCTVMEFIIHNLDLFFVPAGVILILSAWIVVQILIIVKVKKGEWQIVPVESAMLDTFSSSSSCGDLDDLIYDPAYSSLSCNIYHDRSNQEF